MVKKSLLGGWKRKKAKILAEIEGLDLKEVDGLSEVDRRLHLGLRDEFQRKVHQKDIK